MRLIFRRLLLLGLLMLALTVMAGGSLWHHFGDFAADPGFTLSINGEDVDLSGLQDFEGPGLGSLLLAGLVVAVIACVVVPLVLLLSVGLPLLILLLVLGGLALGAVSLGALVFSPIWLIVLVLWLLLRSPRASRR
ncbi:hypothetical protein HNP55_001598 [Paucibacter oligotrophus]|uniref:Uncharacterized protein n=1 Tax=Roseateles oligotrophus TaxID=1769250 RepID=A0A840LAC6_9BURK|nr:hypothetical protein [Roseateles oligotrophus]MBB4843079.1 hypothetical protein [Roseateles oligotrophus]